MTILVSSHSLSSIGSSPVSADNPCGENIRYETVFEELESELAKQESLNAETVDWQVVARLSSAIIQNSSKDLLVGSYLCYALMVTEGYTGLAVGLNALSEMVDSYWDGLFPPLKRLRARQTAFTWLAEKAGQYLTNNVPGPGDSEAIIAAYDAIKALDNSLVDKMGDQAPMLTEVSRPLKNYSQSARAEVEKAGGDPVASASEPAAVTPEAAAPEVQATEPSVELAPAPAAKPANEDPRAAIASHALSSIGSSPISDASPCGEDVRYESEFEQLEAELAKQESLNAETVDWQVVSRLSSSIIQKSSKDLLVGSYLSYALLVTEGYLGFAAGLNVLSDMVDSFWDDLFPPIKRLRARKTAFTWLAEKAGQYLTEHPPGPGDNEAIIAANDIIKSLDGLLVEKMGDQAPMLTDVSRPLKNFSQGARADLEKAAKSAEAAQVPSTPAPAASAPEVSSSEAPATESAPAPAAKPAASEKPKPNIAAPADAGALESDADTKKILRQLQTTMRDIAAFWLAAKLSDPRPYRQNRVAAWMVIESVPPDNAGVTQINPPAPERLKYFEMQAEKDDHATLIIELEKTLARSPFWLDGHFLVVQTLRKLGSEYDDAIQTIIRELKTFLDRLPAMLQLSFSDGTPFASDQSRMWIEAEVLSGGAPGSGAADGAAGELWSSALDTARQMAAGGDTRQAIALMNDGLANSSQIRDQFYWRYALADLLLQVGRAEDATAILEQAGDQAAEMQVAIWEPGLLAKIYNLLFQSYQKQQKTNKDDKVLEVKAQNAFKKFCWFDPVTALSLRGK